MAKLKYKHPTAPFTVDDLVFITDLLEDNGEDESEDPIAECAQDDTEEETAYESDLS